MRLDRLTLMCLAGILVCALAAADSPPPSTVRLNATAAPSYTAQVGGAAVADGASPTARTAGNLGPELTDAEGRLLVREDHPRRFACQLNTDTNSVCQAAPGAGLSLYVTDWMVSASGAQSVDLASGTGTVCGTGTATVVPKVYFSASLGGVALGLRTPFKLPANSALCCRTSAAAGFSCAVNGYVAP